MREVEAVKKKTGNLLFLAAVFLLTLWSVFHGQNLREVLQDLAQADWRCVAAGVLCVVGFILGESLVIGYLLRQLGVTVKPSHCCLYSFIGFFYSCITPSASGGQPMQIVAMRKDRIPVAVSAVVLAIVTITYKLVLVILGGVVVLLRPARLMAFLEPAEPIIYLGMVLNVVCITVLLLLVFHPTAAERLACRALNLAHRIRPFRSLEQRQEQLHQMVEQYRGAASFYRTHRGVIVRVFAITFVQRCLLFLVTWFTYRAFALSQQPLSVVTTLQAMISVAADMLPLPGGMGVSENLFLTLFEPVFGPDLVLPAMVISRGISYYTQLLLSAVMTLAASFLLREPQEKGT